MGRGKKDVPDFIPAGGHEEKTGDVTDEYLSAVDVGKDFTPVTDATAFGLADINEQ